MNKQGIRIISLEASQIYEQIQKNGSKTGYVLPAEKSFKYFRLFKTVLDYSLDAIELEIAYKKKCRKSFSFTDDSNNEYTLAVINLKFNYKYNGKEEKGLKELRQYFYDDGFNLNGVHYVRYKRSADYTALS